MISQLFQDISKRFSTMLKTLHVSRTQESLSGRAVAVEPKEKHAVLGTSMQPPFPAAMQRAVFGLGCFWGAERSFWQLDGVFVTAVGYAGGGIPHPTYREVCSGRTGHAEVVLIIYDPGILCYEKLLTVFFEGHDPTQGMRQGNDVGTQYRSVIHTFSAEQQDAAQAALDLYQEALHQQGYAAISTTISQAQEFYYAEDYHQQYLAKVPNGYCGLGGTGVCMPISAAKA